MNIFVLDYSPAKAAEYHCDKHVVKMILESAQLMSTAHHHFGSPLSSELYKPSHQNHPCAIWVCKTHENYNWLFELFDHLCQEYTRRYKRVHKTQGLMKFLQYPPERMPGTWATPFVQCMPEECKRRDPVEAYRAYYKAHKASMAVWAHSTQPEWWKQ